MQGFYLTLWLCATLSGPLQASPLFVEGDRNASRICKPAPAWEIKGQGAPMKELLGNVVVLALLKASLREKLLRGNLTDVSFLIVNEREAQSRAMYWELRRRASPAIPVYQQAPLQDDVWEALDGDKDDFLVYDRCGRLTFHIVLPYSFLHYPYIEAAIRATYHKDICGNCTVSEPMQSQLDLNSTTWNSTQHKSLSGVGVIVNETDGTAASALTVTENSSPAPNEGGVTQTHHHGPGQHHQNKHYQRQHTHGSDIRGLGSN
uniref:Selenoprotein P N-terminal domain-containing protein n=1 Tax=Esox lucius TaxID=8010 RepID=A0A3P8Y8C2_ESOLU